MCCLMGDLFVGVVCCLCFKDSEDSLFFAVLAFLLVWSCFFLSVAVACAFAVYYVDY